MTEDKNSKLPNVHVLRIKEPKKKPQRAAAILRTTDLSEESVMDRTLNAEKPIDTK